MLRGPIGQRGIGLGPDMLRRVEFRRVGWESVGMDPWMIAQIHLHLPACVDRPPVPEQDHRTPQMLQQDAEEGPDIQAVERPVGSQAEGEPQVAVLGRDREGADGRELVALKPMVEMRGVSPRGPGPSDGRGKRKATLVEEYQVRAQSFSLFLYAARRSVASRRWPARCAGGPGAPVSGSSSPDVAGASRHGRDGSGCPIAAGSGVRSGQASRDRWSSLPPTGPSGGSARGGGAGAASAWAGGQESAWGRGREARPAGRLGASAPPNCGNSPTALQLPTSSGPSFAAGWPVGGAAPTGWGCQEVACLPA